MRTHDRLFIGGEWVPPTGPGTIEVVCPHTEQVIGAVPEGTPTDIDRAVAAARSAFDTGPWPRTDPAERAAAVRRLADLYAGRIPEMNALITQEMGAPISPPAQAGVAATTWRYLADLGVTLTWEEQRPGMSGPVTVRREPAGVVAAIVPWNGPQVTAAAKLAPALVAGCTAVLKPDPQTPPDAYLLANMITEAGFPPGVVNIVAAGPVAGEHLVRHPDVDCVNLAGDPAPETPSHPVVG
jgi:betaine-aldehyde dehydrogenase